MREMNHAGKNWARGNYGANAGPHYWHLSVEGLSLPAEGWSPAPNILAGGVMCINFGARLEQLTGEDGTSNTIMFNELRVGISPYDRRGVWAFGFPGSSVTAGHGHTDCDLPNHSGELSDDILDCYRFWYEGIGANDGMGCYTPDSPGFGANPPGPPDPNNPQPPGHPVYGSPNPPVTHGVPNKQATARSRHPGGVNACFADGSVRFVQNTVFNHAWYMMNSRNDGETYNFFNAYEN